MSTVQLTVPEAGRIRGYYAADILAAWDAIRPDDPEDAQLPEEIDPFEALEDDGTDPAQTPSDVSAGQHEVNEPHKGLS